MISFVVAFIMTVRTLIASSSSFCDFLAGKLFSLRGFVNLKAMRASGHKLIGFLLTSQSPGHQAHSQIWRRILTNSKLGLERRLLAVEDCDPLESAGRLVET